MVVNSLTILLQQKKRFIKTPTNSYDKLNKFGKSLVSGVGMTGIGVAGANVLKKKQKVSKEKQGVK